MNPHFLCEDLQLPAVKRRSKYRRGKVVAKGEASFYHIPTMKRRVITPIICVVGVCLGCTSCMGPATEKRVGGDDGYKLWLKYKKVGNKQKLKAYQQSIRHYDVLDDSPTCEIIKEELKESVGF